MKTLITGLLLFGLCLWMCFSSFIGTILTFSYLFNINYYLSAFIYVIWIFLTFIWLLITSKEDE